MFCFCLTILLCYRILGVCSDWDWEIVISLEFCLRRSMEPRCDFCGTEKALIYCKSDSAKLCLNCDVNVHSANPLSQRHTRSLLSEKCSLQPSAIHCMNENVSLCQGCQWTASNCTGLGHRLQSLNPYSDCPSPSDFGRIWSSTLEPSVTSLVSPFSDTLLQELDDWNGSSTSVVTQTQNLKDYSSFFPMESNLPKVIEEVTCFLSNISKCFIYDKEQCFSFIFRSICRNVLVWIYAKG